MKKRNLIAVIALCFCATFSLFGLAGCGDVKVSTLKENFELLDKAYQNNPGVFVTGKVDGIETKYKVKYSVNVDKHMANGESKYMELEELYNVSLVISNDYIDQNKGYILALDQKELTGKVKESLNKLNKNLKDYIKQIDAFVDAHKTFITHFSLHDEVNEEANNNFLSRFKSSYGELVDKNVKLSMSLAEAVEATEVFDLLKKIEPLDSDTGIVKEYIRAKALSVFTDFEVNALPKQLTGDQTDIKSRIENLNKELKEQFKFFKQNFVTNNYAYVKLSKEAMNELFDKTKEFFLQAEKYSKTLEKIDIKKMTTDFESYKKTNKLAEVYLTELEQFVENILPTFLQYVNNLIYVR